MYPAKLIPTDIEPFDLNGTTIEIPKSILRLDKWIGLPVKETFGGKPIVDFDNKPMFAELAIMKTFITDGWDARWIETYARGNREPIYLTEWKDEVYKNQNHVPILDVDIKKMMAGIANINLNTYSGCWDVLAWKDGTVIFSESKRHKKDSIRETQNNWLAAGLKFGLKPQNYLIVEWDFE